MPDLCVQLVKFVRLAPKDKPLTAQARKKLLELAADTGAIEASAIGLYLRVMQMLERRDIRTPAPGLTEALRDMAAALNLPVPDPALLGEPRNASDGEA